MELKLLDTTQDMLNLIFDMTDKLVEFILKSDMQTMLKTSCQIMYIIKHHMDPHHFSL